MTFWFEMDFFNEIGGMFLSKNSNFIPVLSIFFGGLFLGRNSNITPVLGINFGGIHASQIYGGVLAKFCGLLRINELYYTKRKYFRFLFLQFFNVFDVFVVCVLGHNF